MSPPPPNVTCEIHVRGHVGHVTVNATTAREYAFLRLSGMWAVRSEEDDTVSLVITGRDAMRKVAEMILGHLEVSEGVQYRRKRRAQP